MEGEAELGLEDGDDELAKCGVDVFMFFLELLGLGVCECEEEAVYRGRG